MALTTTDIIEIFQTRASAQYGGEAVSQFEHAMQCAHLAEKAGEEDTTVVTAMLHDLGHLLVDKRVSANDETQERDDLHQHIAIPFLRGLLPDAVIEPIRMHVDAKRYLCSTEPSYWASLSPASKRSLELQGGVYTQDQCKDFIAQPFADVAVRLRRYDDLAKEPRAVTPGLAHFTAKLKSIALA
jgi:phosphonate degradation associated HDIG domain protein